MSQKKKQSQEEQLARKRAEVILQVRAGKMTVKQAAKALGISRKTYYEWEEKGLEGMMGALKNRPPGRPKIKTDEEKEKLKKKVQDLERRLSLTDHVEELKRLVQGLPSLTDLNPDNPIFKDKKRG